MMERGHFMEKLGVAGLGVGIMLSGNACFALEISKKIFFHRNKIFQSVLNLTSLTWLNNGPS